MEDFEGYVIRELGIIHEKVHKIDKKLAVFSGGMALVASIVSIVFTKIL